MCSPTGTTRGWPRPPRSAPNCEPCFATEHPDLLQMADELAASSDAVDGFLETPALALAARDLAQDEPPLPEGTFVGPYRIVSLLARGGMGDVYRATDPRLGRDVALKTLPKAEPDDAHALERFVQEARVTASLDHPNIVKVFDVGHVERSPVPGLGAARRRDLASADPQRAGRHRQTPAASPPR